MLEGMHALLHPKAGMMVPAHHRAQGVELLEVLHWRRARRRRRLPLASHSRLCRVVGARLRLRARLRQRRCIRLCRRHPNAAEGTS